MPRFRRKRRDDALARWGGLAFDPEPPETLDPRGWMEVGVHGVPRVREWDAVTAAEAPDLREPELEFVALADGRLLGFGEEEPALAPLAGALEASLQPPYRARAIRRDGALYAVAARVIEVAELPPGLEADELEAGVYGGEVQGDEALAGWVREQRPELRHFAARARRLTPELWEVRVDPL